MVWCFACLNWDCPQILQVADMYRSQKINHGYNQEDEDDDWCWLNSWGCMGWSIEVNTSLYSFHLILNRNLLIYWFLYFYDHWTGIDQSMRFQFISSWFEWLRVYSDLCIPHDTASCFSFFLFIAFHLWILWAYQGSIKLYRRKLSCIDTNPLSTLLALICITFFSFCKNAKAHNLSLRTQHAIFMFAYGKLEQHMRCFVDGQTLQSYNRTKPVWSFSFAAT